MQLPNFWRDREHANKVSEEFARLKEEVRLATHILNEITEISEFIGYAERDESIANELQERIDIVRKDIEKEETALYFQGPYDKNNVVLTVFSGAGGVDAQDWASMLLRMYEHYCVRKGYKTIRVSESFGEEGGTKEATIEIEGRYAYGYLKHENGVHRLVRISPYSAQKLRHTSFALVEVLPQLPRGSSDAIEIKLDDIEVQTFRSSGPGGQYVNKRESAVRIKHLPSGIVVSCQNERLQGENKASAMRLLAAKLFARKMREEKEKLEAIRGGFISAEWGSQIRSYVLNPYQMVKDHRTEIETSDVEAVLDGNLDAFIEVEIKQ